MIQCKQRYYLGSIISYRRMPIELVDDAAEFMVKVGRRFVKKLE